VVLLLVFPKKDPEIAAAEKQQFIDDQRSRTSVEGKIGQGRRRYGLGLICEKLAETQCSSIAMNILVMNIQKLLELLLSFLFSCVCYRSPHSASRG
jgi:IS5 family transposase